MSTIHLAALEGDLKKIKDLLASNPHLVNQKNPLGFTPLHLAARYGHFTVVKFLVEKNACLEMKNHKGETPAEVTRSPKIGKYIQTCAEKHNKSCASHRLHHEMLEEMQSSLSTIEKENLELKAQKSYYEEQTRQLKDEFSRLLAYCQDYNSQLPSNLLDVTQFQNMLQSHLLSHPPRSFVSSSPSPSTGPNSPSPSPATNFPSPAIFDETGAPAHNILKKENSFTGISSNRTPIVNKIQQEQIQGRAQSPKSPSAINLTTTTPFVEQTTSPTKGSSPLNVQKPREEVAENNKGSSSPLKIQTATEEVEQVDNIKESSSPLNIQTANEEVEQVDNIKESSPLNIQKPSEEDEEKELEQEISEFEHANALIHEIRTNDIILSFDHSENGRISVKLEEFVKIHESPNSTPTKPSTSSCPPEPEVAISNDDPKEGKHVRFA